MAINFNMVAFIPLIGVSIAASVLVGHHLTSTGVVGAVIATRSALAIGAAYSTFWAILYIFAPDWLLSFYRLGQSDTDTIQAIAIARTLLKFVAIYVFFDFVQLILAGALRGAGDTWFVLGSVIVASFTSIIIGMIGADFAAKHFEISVLYWWWGIITLWVWLLAIVMIARYRGGRWQAMRMVS